MLPRHIALIQRAVSKSIMVSSVKKIHVTALKMIMGQLRPPVPPIQKNENLRDIIYFWKPPATCRSNMSLPEPLKNIDCNIKCSKGTHLNYDRNTLMSKCLKCDPGRYSMQGALWFGPSWVPGELPPQFTTTCFDDGPQSDCSPWQGMGQFIESGENNGVNNMDSVLSFRVSLSTSGMVSFYYSVDSEDRFDKLYFYVDGDTLLTTMKTISKWREFNATFSRGQHLLRWVYSKDSSKTKGKDRAYLRNITITGIRSNDLTCLACPPGRYQPNSGSEKCDACPSGQFSSTYGSEMCLNCKPWEMSQNGSSKCETNTACGDSDYYSKNSSCVNRKLTTSFHWLKPKKCYHHEFKVGTTTVGRSENNTLKKFVDFEPKLKKKPHIRELRDWKNKYKESDFFEMEWDQVSESGFLAIITRVNNTVDNTTGWGQNLEIYWEAEGDGIPLPHPKNVSCKREICMAGQGVVNLGGPCEACPYGKVSEPWSNSCHKCDAGKGATNYTWYITHWPTTTIPQCGATDVKFLCTQCKSPQCGTPGWRNGLNFLDSGMGHGVGVESSLSLFIDTLKDPVYSAIQFDYVLSCGSTDINSAYVLVSFDDSFLHKILCKQICDETRRKLAFNIPKHNVQKHSITWTFYKSGLLSGNYSHRCDYFRLYSVTLSGGKLMGTKKGDTLGGAVSCTICDKGYFSEQNSCRACPSGKYSDQKGVAVCKSCPLNSFTLHPGKTSCTTCGAHTSVDKDHTKCHTNCLMESEDLNQYNLTGLPSFQKYFFDTGNLTNDVNFFFSLCKPLSETAIPQSDYKWMKTLNDIGWSTMPYTILGESSPAHVVIAIKAKSDYVTGVNAGSLATFSPSNASGDIRPHVQISFSQGSNITCLKDDKTIDKEFLRTEIDVVCAPEVDVGQPVPFHTVNYDSRTKKILVPCVNKFVWASKYGCPLCKLQNQRIADGECIDGQKTRTYVRISNCIDGVPLPPDVFISCDNEGLTLTSGEVAGLAVAASLFVLIVAVAVFYLVKKNNNLTEINKRFRDDYSNLEQAGAAVELQKNQGNDNFDS